MTLLYRAETDRQVVRDRGLAKNQRFVPAGFLFGWLIENDSTGPAVAADTRKQFLRRIQTGPQAFASTGGVLDGGTVGAPLLEFVRDYLVSDPISNLGNGAFNFWLDMAEEFPVPSIFDVRDTWHNYEWMRIRLISRYSQWRTREFLETNRS